MTKEDFLKVASADMFINGAFVWGSTEEGTGFWVSLDTDWQDFLTRNGR